MKGKMQSLLLGVHLMRDDEYLEFSEGKEWIFEQLVFSFYAFFKIFQRGSKKGSRAREERGLKGKWRRKEKWNFKRVGKVDSFAFSLRKKKWRFIFFLSIPFSIRQPLDIIKAIEGEPIERVKTRRRTLRFRFSVLLSSSPLFSSAK